jgi:tetratricopeptide (TPR) repeat protein
MKKTQIIFLIAGIIVIGALFSLPTVVVDNSEDDVVMDESGSVITAPSLADTHENELPASVREQVDQLKAELEDEGDREKYTILADSIGKVFHSSGKPDSAAYFYALPAEKFSDIEFIEKAGNTYYEAYGFAMTPEKTTYLAGKTREYLGKVLEQDPSRLDVKTKIAMTHVSSSNPMQGITMLREILEQDPTNESALFNMGVLSMQSGQYKMAVQRFEELVANHPRNIEGQFFLGVSYYESKQQNKAKTQLQLVRDMTDDPQILAGVENYLDRL